MFHCGSKHPDVLASNDLLSHQLSSDRAIEQASEQMSAAEHVIEVSSAEQANARAVRANEQMEKRVALHLRRGSGLFWTVVRSTYTCD